MAVIVREIRSDDLEQIMEWRMDPDITKFMNTNPKLTIEGQKKWFEKIKTDDSVQYWIIEKDGKPVGVINLAEIDMERRRTSWGYYVGDKEARSFKMALALEMSLYDYVFDVLGLDELYGTVLSINAGVIRLHRLCGSRVISEVKGEIEKDGVKYDNTHMSITRKEWNEIRASMKYEKIDFGTKKCD